MMEIINQILQQLLSNFDITYCVVVNILTYVLITILINICKGNVTRTIKKIILLISIVVIGVVYYVIGEDIKIIVNSSILAPVSWTWLVKPILAKMGYDYKDIDKLLN